MCVLGSREPKAGMVAEGGLWRRDSPCFPERNRGLFVKMENQNLLNEGESLRGYVENALRMS